MPPWSFPQSYCQSIDSSLTSYSSTSLGAKTVLDAQYAFCASWTNTIWQTSLYIAVAFWVFVTALNVLHSFEWGDLTGYSLQRLIKVIAHQVWWLLAALASFYLLLLAEQFVYLVAHIFTAFLGGNQWHTDAITWNQYGSMINDTASYIQWDQSCHSGPGVCSSPPFGTQDIFLLGFKRDWVIQSLQDLAGWLPNLILAVRFVMMLIIIGSAPIAFIARCHHITRGLFRHWFTFWLELEAMSLVGALGIVVYHSLQGPLNQLNLFNTSNWNGWDNVHTDKGTLQNAEFLRLTLVALIGGVAFAFIMRAVGNFVTTMMGFFTTQKNAENAEGAQIAGGIGIGAALVFTGIALAPLTAGGSIAAGWLAAAAAAPAIAGAVPQLLQAGNVPGAGGNFVAASIAAAGTGIAGLGDGLYRNYGAAGRLARQNANQAYELQQARQALMESNELTGNLADPIITAQLPNGTPTQYQSAEVVADILTNQATPIFQPGGGISGWALQNNRGTITDAELNRVIASNPGAAPTSDLGRMRRVVELTNIARVDPGTRSQILQAAQEAYWVQNAQSLRAGVARGVARVNPLRSTTPFTDGLSALEREYGRGRATTESPVRRGQNFLRAFRRGDL